VTDDEFLLRARQIVDYLTRLKYRDPKRYDTENHMLTRLEDSILMICEMHRLFPDAPNKYTTHTALMKTFNKVRLALIFPCCSFDARPP
jgi:hypothetical protein